MRRMLIQVPNTKFTAWTSDINAALTSNPSPSVAMMLQEGNTCLNRLWSAANRHTQSQQHKSACLTREGYLDKTGRRTVVRPAQ